jgi:hypothetical protein
MRSVGLGLAFAATVQFVLVSTPAFAQPPSDTTAPAPAAATPAPAADAPAVTANPTVPPTPIAGKVTVHIQSSKPVSLERYAAGGNGWEFACSSPCDQSLSTSDQYRIVGTGLNESKTFLLDTSVGEKVTLDVSPGSKAKSSTGTWLLVGGGALIVGGIITLIAGSSSNAVAGNDGTTTSTKNTNWIFVGTSLILGGVIVGMTGGSFMVDNAHTKVDGAIDARSDKNINNDVTVKASVTASRLPTWHDEKGPVLAPVTNIVPIVNASF